MRGNMKKVSKLMSSWPRNIRKRKEKANARKRSQQHSNHNVYEVKLQADPVGHIQIDANSVEEDKASH